MASWYRQGRKRERREGCSGSIVRNLPFCSRLFRKHTFSAAAALATAKLTPRMALAPNFPLFAVPSSWFKNASTFGWSLTSMFSLMRAGPMISLTLATALVTPLPAHFVLSPSRSSTASCWPNAQLKSVSYRVYRVRVGGTNQWKRRMGRWHGGDRSR
jgi:hypothetical protein